MSYRLDDLEIEKGYVSGGDSSFQQYECDKCGYSGTISLDKLECPQCHFPLNKNRLFGNKSKK